VRARRERRLEATLQKILNEYPDDSLDRIVDWAGQGKLAHTWDACLNAAAVGHDIDGPEAVETELGIPAFLADGLARIWDQLGDRDFRYARVCLLSQEILQARSRRVARAQSGFGPGAPLPRAADERVTLGSAP
jgi:hypothetical protein